MTATTIITHRRIARWGACAGQAETARRLYPAGVPLTEEAAVRLKEAGCDPLWGLLRLLTRAQRRAFIAWTLTQRQPHLVTLLRSAGLDAHADAVAQLADPASAEAQAAYAAARDAAGAAWAAWDAAWAARDAARAAGDARDAARAAGDARDAAGAAAYMEQVRWCLDALHDGRTP